VKRFNLLLSLFLLVATIKLGLFSSIKSDQSIFFPAKIFQKLTELQKFKYNRWNLLLIPSTTKVKCGRLKKEFSGFIDSVFCHGELSSFGNYIGDWSQDIIYRQPFLGKADLLNRQNRSLSKLSLPLGADSEEIINLYASDPLEAYVDLIEIVKKGNKAFGSGFQSVSVEGNKFNIYPILPNFPVKDELKLTTLMNTIKSSFPKALVIGPFGASFRNMVRIKKDITMVSVVGAIIFFFYFTFNFIKEGTQFFRVLPVLVNSLLLAIIFNYLIFGQIHGVVLAFSPTLIGLGLDYAFHRLYGHEKRASWRANFSGWVTSLIVLLCLSFSDVPFIKQFSMLLATGLTFSLVLFYLELEVFSSFTPLMGAVKIPKNNFFFKASIPILILCSTLFFFKTNFSLSLNGLEYVTSEIQNTRRSIFGQKNFPKPTFLIDSKKDMARVLSRKTPHPSISVANFFPTQAVAKVNLNSWAQEFNTEGIIQSKIFNPYFENFSTHLKQAPSIELAISQGRSYFSDLLSKDSILSVFFIENDSLASFKEIFPQSFSLGEIADSFPRLLKNELKLVFPISLILILLYLFVYFHFSIKKTIFSILPFLTGLGLQAIGVLFLKEGASFVFLVGTLIVYGLSVDYGIFAVSSLESTKEDHRYAELGIWHAGISTLLGMIPLLLASHPVLFQLGLSCSLGIIGPLICAVYGIPLLKRYAV
jgi:hypothetical protein